MKNQWFSAINTRYELFENDGKTEAVLRFNSQEVLVNVYLYPRASNIRRVDRVPSANLYSPSRNLSKLKLWLQELSSWSCGPLLLMMGDPQMAMWRSEIGEQKMINGQVSSTLYPLEESHPCRVSENRAIKEVLWPS